MLALSAGDRVEGQRLMDEALAIFERTEDGPGVESTPLSLGAFELDTGDPQRACELFQRCIRIASTQGLYRNRGWAAAELAEAALALGDHALARSALDEALELLAPGRNTLALRYARSLEERLAAPAAS